MQKRNSGDEDRDFMLCASAPPYGRCATFLRWLVLKDAPQRFARLIQSPVKVERLYGLLGLWLTDPTEFDKAAPAFKRDAEQITDWWADSPKRSTIAGIAAEIAKGTYDFAVRDRLQKPLTIFARYSKNR
jgi:hypothetical protein